jgi:hypothetical protein
MTQATQVPGLACLACLAWEMAVHRPGASMAAASSICSARSRQIVHPELGHQRGEAASAIAGDFLPINLERVKGELFGYP